MDPRSDGTPEHIARLRGEVERLRDQATRHIDRADRLAHMWAVIDIALGFPAALLAAVSGAAGLAAADARIPAGFLALASAGLSAGAGFLRCDMRRIANKRSRQAWAVVESEALLVLAQDTFLDRDALQQALRALFDQRQAALAAYEGDASA